MGLVRTTLRSERFYEQEKTARNQIGPSGQSGWADSNRRPPRPKRGALASCATPRWKVSIMRMVWVRQAIETDRLQSDSQIVR